MSNNTKVGFIGLGQMGMGMAQNILDNGHALSVFDISDTAMQTLAEHGSHACSSAMELAQRCNLILLCLPSSDIVENVLFCDEGILSAESKITVIDTSTLNKLSAIDFAQRCKQRDVHYCDCPVSGLPQRAKDGTLTSMFGGDDDTFNRTRSLLECFSSTVVHCGDIGSGQAMKTINNIIYNINIAALCEVLPTAVASGLKPDALQQVTSSGSSSSFASNYFVPKMLNNTFTGDFTMDSALKDLQNMQGMAAETGADMPLTLAMMQAYNDAIAAGFGAESKSAMLKVYEMQLGVWFRN
jgi:3-hydroxyisobutyrate dehydrogenase-like beta-hydroxyacid dehydrogenase